MQQMWKRTLGSILMAGLLILAGLVLAGPVGAGQSGRANGFDQAQIEDVLQVLRVDRGLVAVGIDGSSIRLALESGEVIQHTAARGRVGVALTDRRVAATASGSGWRVQRLRIGEQIQEEPILGTRVALVLTDVRMLGFAGEIGSLVEERFQIREKWLQREVSSSVAVVVTNRRALGLSPTRRGFFEIDLRPTEKNPTLTTSGTMATLVTKNRILIFDGINGGWRERKIKNLR